MFLPRTDSSTPALSTKGTAKLHDHLVTDSEIFDTWKFTFEDGMLLSHNLTEVRGCLVVRPVQDNVVYDTDGCARDK